MHDRTALIFVLALLAGLLVTRSCKASAGDLPDGAVCDPDARARSWTPDEKRETRERIARACKRVGGSELYCDIWQAAVWRESWGGVASAVHTRGVDRWGEAEYGLGPLGLSVRSHRSRWPGADEDPAFCIPEVSFALAHEVAWRAVTIYGAHDARGIQAIFGNGRGAFERVEHGVPDWWHDVPGLAWVAELLPRWVEYRVTPQPRHIAAVCSRMGYAGGRLRCSMPITVEDLGRRIPLEERRAWALSGL